VARIAAGNGGRGRTRPVTGAESFTFPAWRNRYLAPLLLPDPASAVRGITRTGHVVETAGDCVAFRGPARKRHRTRARRRRVMTEPEIDTAISLLEGEMPGLQLRYRDLFSYANAWAVRYDAILAGVPDDRLDAVKHRLNRIGVRWGVAAGVRLTGQFPALKLPA
jgi:hypothetical protein